MEKIFLNIENSKTNKLHKFVLKLSQRFDLKSSNKHAILQNTRKQCKKNKLKIIAHIRNDQFELPDGFYSVSDIQKYIEYTIKKKKK